MTGITELPTDFPDDKTSDFTKKSRLKKKRKRDQYIIHFVIVRFTVSNSTEGDELKQIFEGSITLLAHPVRKPRFGTYVTKLCSFDDVQDKLKREETKYLASSS